ncbi:MAG: transcriptional regulator [Chitinophagales bacterium]
MTNYIIIRTEDQYYAYCNELERLSSKYQDNPSDMLLDKIETLTLLIEHYDQEHSTLNELDPIELLKYLMKENQLKQIELANLLQISKGHLSDILSYKKGLSKNIIRLLSERFKVRQSAFNRPYKLISDIDKQYRNAS